MGTHMGWEDAGNAARNCFARGAGRLGSEVSTSKGLLSKPRHTKISGKFFPPPSLLTGSYNLCFICSSGIVLASPELSFSWAVCPEVSSSCWLRNSSRAWVSHRTATAASALNLLPGRAPQLQNFLVSFCLFSHILVRIPTPPRGVL